MMVLEAPCSRGADVPSRVSDAALQCIDTPNRSVILIEPVCVAGHDLASLIMGMGFDVFHGPHMPGTEFPPLILVGSAALRRPSAQQALATGRAHHPHSSVCAVTGAFADVGAAGRVPPPQYEDARACLQAAGIGFCQIDAVQDAKEA